jgi:hypothetical protein
LIGPFGAFSVSDASLLAWDFALRGSAAGLFLIIAIILLRDRRLTALTILGPLLALAAAGFALWTAPGFPQLNWRSAGPLPVGQRAGAGLAVGKGRLRR